VGYYKASSGIAYRRFGTTYQSHLHELRLADLWREGNTEAKEKQQDDNLMQDINDYEKN